MEALLVAYKVFVIRLLRRSFSYESVGERQASYWWILLHVVLSISNLLRACPVSLMIRTGDLRVLGSRPGT